MKKILTFILVSVFAIGAQAQIVSSHSRSIKTESNYAPYSRLELSYAPIVPGGDNGKIYDTATGIRLGYVYGASIASSCPLYLEGGINATYAFGTTKGLYVYGKKSNVDMTGFNVNIPFNLTYRFNVADNIVIAPYAGLHARINIIGKTKGGGKTIDIFDKDDVDDTAKRVQIGGQVGVGAEFNRFYLGVGYESQFGEYAKDFTTGGAVVTAGIKF